MLRLSSFQKPLKDFGGLPDAVVVQKRNIITGFVAALLSVAAFAAPASAATATLPPTGSEFVATTAALPPLLPGSNAWITGTFLGKFEVTDFKVTATGTDGITFSYPNGQDYTSLNTDSTLSTLELDYVALRVKVPSNEPAGLHNITVNLSYKVDGVARTQTYTIPLATVIYLGGNFTQVTSAVTVPAASSQWVNVSYLGVAPSTDNFRLAIKDAKGAAISYPSDGTSTGLLHDTSLSAGETDLVAFKVGTGTLAKGTYALTWEVTYGATGSTKTQSGTLNLVVS